jgi:hypothetical protein
VEGGELRGEGGQLSGLCGVEVVKVFKTVLEIIKILQAILMCFFNPLHFIANLVSLPNYFLNVYFGLLDFPRLLFNLLPQLLASPMPLISLSLNLSHSLPPLEPELPFCLL